MNRDTLQFLRDLANNNNREWFQENRLRYDAARQDVLSLTNEMIGRIAEFDNEVAYLEPKDCLFRIYRDVRFSPDKSPYKRHFGTYIAKNGGHRSLYSGYYIHLEPGNCMLSGGLWCPDSAGVKGMRSIIDADYEQLQEIVNEPKFKTLFGGRLESFEPPLKSVPRGYDKEHPAAEWLKMRSWCVAWKFDDEMLFLPDFTERLAEGCRAMMPFSHWCNEAYFG